MKRILFITAFVPSRISAGENYSRQLINDIAGCNKVDLVFFKYRKDLNYVIESQNVNVVKIFRNSGYIKLLNFCMFPFLFPLFTARFNLCRLLIIKKILKETKYDFVVFDYSQTFLFARFIKNIPLILNSHDVIAQRYSRVYGGLLAPYAKISERYLLKNINAGIFSLSEKDCALLKQYYSVIAIKTDVYLEQNIVNATCRTVGDYFILFANWSRPDNLNGLKWFLKKVFSELTTKTKIKIIGPGLSPEVLNELSAKTNITYEGFMENPYPLIANSLALISPLFSGAGVKIKVVDSMACGTPVIGTKLSLEGIDERFLEYNVVAETPDDFITAISLFRIEEKRKAELKDAFLASYQNKALVDLINSSPLL